MGLLESAYLTAGHTSEEAKQTYSDLNAVLGDSGQAVEASQHLALIADNEKELTELTDILTGVYSAYGESLPLEGLAEAIGHSSSLGTVQGNLADALEWADIAVEDFNKQLAECSDEEERQQLIVDTLNGLYKKNADQYKETNKDVMDANRANERLANAMAEVGKVGEPIVTEFKNMAASLAEKLAPALQTGIDKIKDIAKWIKDNKETVELWTGIILGATTTIGAFLLILNWGTIMATASSAINTVKTAILGMNTAMLANPIGLIVAVIAGLVVAFIYLWNNVDGFKQFWIDAWAWIKKSASDAWEWIKGAFAGIGTWFSEKFTLVKEAGKNAMDSVKKWFSDAWKSIKDTFSGIGKWFSTKFTEAWNGIKKAFGKFTSFFGGLWDGIKEKFSSIGTALGTAMGDAVKKGINLVIRSVENIINTGISLINGAIKLANKIPGVNVGTVKKLTLPRLAKGGVLEQGQVGLLEGTGAEAVVPLERNTQWIDRVASQFESRMKHRNEDLSNQLVIDRLNTVISMMEELMKRNIYLDSGVLVGELSAGIDANLGNRYKYIQRGNTRG
jgi:phage-related protein